MQRMSCNLLLMDLSWIYICAVMNFQFDIFLSFCLSWTMHLKVTIRIKLQGKVFRGQEIDFNNIFLYQFYNYYLSQKKKNSTIITLEQGFNSSHGIYSCYSYDNIYVSVIPKSKNLKSSIIHYATSSDLHIHIGDLHLHLSAF